LPGQKYLVHFLTGVRKGNLQASSSFSTATSSIPSTSAGSEAPLENPVEIRKIADEMEVVWINGNHDGPAEIVSHLLGVRCADEIIVKAAERSFCSSTVTGSTSSSRATRLSHGRGPDVQLPPAHRQIALVCQVRGSAGANLSAVRQKSNTTL